MTPFTARKILTSQTVGERLAKIRHGSNLALGDAARQIGIKRVYLEAIEAGLYNELPGDIYALEFIKSYARFLRLDPAAIARAYARERAGQISRPATRQPPGGRWSGQPRFLFKVSALAIAGIVVFYLLGAAAISLSPPRLEVLSPPAYYEAADARVLLSGQTAPAARLFVNSQELTLDASGAFTEIFHLPPGLTLLQIAARDKYDRQRVVYRTIRVPAVVSGMVLGASTTREVLLSK